MPNPPSGIAADYLICRIWETKYPFKVEKYFPPIGKSVPSPRPCPALASCPLCSVFLRCAGATHEV